MLRTYLRTAVRSLRAAPVVTAINVAGLAIALAACVTVFLFLQVYYDLDTFHEHAERLVIVNQTVVHQAAEEGGLPQTWATTPTPLGPALEADLPQVEAAVRLRWAGADVRTTAVQATTASFRERVLFADPGFFEAFTFPLQSGTASLTDPATVTLSATAATRLFGDADPLGQPLRLAFGGGDTRPVTVGGVAAPFPDNASLRFDLLLPFGARPDAVPQDLATPSWATSDVATVLLLRAPSDVGTVAAQMTPYVERQRAAQATPTVTGYVFEHVGDPPADGYEVRQRVTEAAHPALAAILSALALFMVALAAFNYVNIALGQAARRFKEIGVRKVLGGSRGQLVAQFMTEHVLLCTLAMGLGLVVAYVGMVPLFNRLFVLQISLNPLANLGLWGYLVGLLAVVAAVSGAYPALYVAGFRPVVALRGTLRLGKQRWLTRGLLTAQFVIAALAVLFSVLLAFNGRYLLDQSWGYEAAQAVVVPLTDAAQVGPLRNAALQSTAVAAVAEAEHHIGLSFARHTVALPGAARRIETLRYAVGSGYADVLGLNLVAGRFLDPEQVASDRTGAVVVNERFVAEAGWTDPVGQTLVLDSETVEVVGIVGDFLFDPVVSARPSLFVAATQVPSYLIARARPGQQASAIAALERVWTQITPEEPFEVVAQAEVFDVQLASYANLARGCGTLAALALLIACMGLFGLASQNAARRLKEVSVRKVLGASVTHVVLVANRGFVVLLAVAATIATGIAGGALLLIGRLDVMNLMPLGPGPFVAAYVLLIGAVALSVGAQSYRLITANPADVLRSA